MYSMLSQQYYTTCATSSLYNLNLTPTFGADSYHPSSTSPLFRGNSSTSAAYCYVIPQCWGDAGCPATRVSLFTTKNPTKKKATAVLETAVDGKRWLARRKMWTKLHSTGAEKKKPTPSPPVERNFVPGPSAWIGYLLNNIHRPRGRDCNAQQYSSCWQGIVE